MPYSTLGKHEMLKALKGNFRDRSRLDRLAHESGTWVVERKPGGITLPLGRCRLGRRVSVFCCWSIGRQFPTDSGSVRFRQVEPLLMPENP